jgi:glucose dehydrogenase
MPRRCGTTSSKKESGTSVFAVRWLPGVVAIVATVAVSATLAEQTGTSPSKGETEWRFFGGDAGATRYSPANQISAANVRNLDDRND